MTYVAEICGTWVRVVARQRNGSAGRVVLDFLRTAGGANDLAHALNVNPRLEDEWLMNI